MKLRIKETRQRYVGLGIALLGFEDYSALGSPSYVTVDGFVFPAKAEDVGKGVVCIDGFMRKSLGKTLGDEVEVLPTTKPPDASTATLAPSEGRVGVSDEFVKFVKDKLRGRVLNTGEIIPLPVLGTHLIWKVKEVVPSPAIFTDETRLTLLEEAMPPPPPPAKGFEKLLPTWTSISEEDGLSIEETCKYRIHVKEGGYYFADEIKLEGGFVSFTPKLYSARHQSEYYKPEKLKAIILPSYRVEIIEDPERVHWLFKDLKK